VNEINTEANLVSVTWDLAAITQMNWKANSTFLNGTSAGSLYIQPSDNAIVVAPLPTIEAINGTVTGFALFATQLVYNNATYLESQFWARQTNFTNVFGVTWVAENVNPGSGWFPVVIKGVT
jgi:hypothetical protein